MTQLLTPRKTFHSPGKVTFREFLKQTEGIFAEWVDKEIVIMAPVSNEHSDLVMYLSSLIRFFVEANKLGEVRGEPFVMQPTPRANGRSPDILFVAAKNAGRIKESHLEGPADLVIEVISPSTRLVDRRDKYLEYEEGGVKEYWIIDPLRKSTEFYLLGKDGIYAPIPLEKGVYHSTVLKGLWIDTAWLWQRPLPTLMSVLKKWQLV